MAVEYTPAVTRALEAAQRQAGDEGAPAVEPRHLLPRLLREEEARPWLMLVQAGVDANRLRAAFPVGQTVDGSAASRVPQSNATLEVLRQARVLARDFAADSVVASELVLLALLRHDAALRQLLEGLGLDFARLEEEMRAAQPPPLRLDEPLELEEWVEHTDSARVLDANANRAREALRVVEDYCRFVLNDGVLSGELKQLRHQLTSALSELAPQSLLAARDTVGDVGTTLATEQERRRASLHDVVQANCKRLQEAVRCLEEVGKLHSPALGERLERLRYQCYTLERAVLAGRDARHRLVEARLQVLVTATQCRCGLERTVRAAADGGAQLIQLREKSLNDRELIERARQVRQWTRQAGVLFVVNDRPDIARLVEADGVHLGQDDLPVRDARRLLGPEAVIGVSTHDLRQVRQAVLDGAGYIGIGPTFPSGTKEFEAFPGLDFVRRSVAATALPAFAIGGITLSNLEAVLAARARRVAVSGAICQSEEPQATAAAFRRLLDQETAYRTP
jgi:thiamine-phosphate pyrophosphorylase